MAETKKEMWKEQLSQRIDHSRKHNWTGGFAQEFIIEFVSNQMEQLINEIPEKCLHDQTNIPQTKQQLKDKWLNQ